MNDLVPPYVLIREGLAAGTVIPFLGAGASLGARTRDTAAEPLPSGSQLAEWLAERANFPPGEARALATVAQYYEVVSGRRGLNTELHGLFDRDFEASRLHAALPGFDGLRLVMTTNYDDMIEEAFVAAGRPFDLVVHTTDPKLGGRVLWWPHGSDQAERVLPGSLDVDLEQTTVIYKMHGTVDPSGRDQFVITENDYVDFLTRLTTRKAVPAMISEHFRSRHFLFLGYGLGDWNFRVVLHQLHGEARRTEGEEDDVRSWAIDLFASPLARRFWQSRGVELYAMSIDDFLDGLEGA